MKITVVNGSPKGEYSITLKTVEYLEKLHPEHTFTVLHAGQRIAVYEKDFSEAAEKLKSAEMILFCYPVYTFLVPYQLHRFLELMKASGVSFEGKWMSQISTSKHFYDVTAHRFMEDNAHDLGLKVVKGLSADMDDLLKEKGRKDAENFFDYLMFCVENDVCESAALKNPDFTPQKTTVPESVDKKQGDVVIVADIEESDRELAAMIDRFRAVCPYETRIVNIRTFPFKGGCISCFNCAADGKCIYKDNFDTFLRENIQTAQAIVIAFTVKDHSMGSRFKLYDDRQFCNGHRTVTMGKPFGYLVNGPYSRETNLKTVAEARAEVGGNFLAGVASNETDPDREIDALALRLDYAIRKKYVQPANFYGVGGMKIFRDLIWQMQGLMRADHKFYKAHGQYDFPQKHFGTMLKMYPIGVLMANKKLMAKAGSKVKEGMIGPYRKVIDKKS